MRTDKGRPACAARRPVDPGVCGAIGAILALALPIATCRTTSEDTGSGVTPMSLPPGYGDCRPGSTRCSEDRIYIEICGPTGHWHPVARCDISHILGPSANWKCYSSCRDFCGSRECVFEWDEARAFCGVSSTGGDHMVCVIGQSASAEHDASGEALVTSCSEDAARLQVAAGEWLAAACKLQPPPGVTLPSPHRSCCRDSPDDWPYDCAGSPGPWYFSISCPCEEWTSSSGRRYGACQDTGIGRPGTWGDEVTGTSIEALASYVVGPDGVCEDPGTFSFGGFCLPVGVGWCTSHEHCPDEYRCGVSPPYDGRCVFLR